MQKHIFLSLVSMLLLGAAANAQTATIKGIVQDSVKKEELGAATIKIGDKGVATNILDGSYRLEVPAGKQKIEFSYIGYNTKTIEVDLADGEEKTLNVLLSETETMLNVATVTSSKFAKPLSEVTVSMEVIQPDLIANRNSITANEALVAVPGVSMIDDQVDIRGGAGYAQGTGGRVLILMDDMPIMQADGGMTNWRDLPTENIAQMEIVKGAASALYGSSAMNGIINIRTAYPTDKPVTKISIFNTFYGDPKDDNNKWWNNTNKPYERGVQVGHRQRLTEKLDLVAGFSLYDHSSWMRGGGVDSTPNYDNHVRASVNLRYRFSDRLTFALNTNFNSLKQNRHLFWTRVVGQSLYESDPTSIPIRGTGNRFTIDPSVTYYDKFSNKHKIQARYYFIDNNNANMQANSSNYVYGEYQYQRRFENLQGLEVAAGVVGSHNNVVSEAYSNETFTQGNLAAYLQLEKKFIDRLTLSFGFRYEANFMGAPDSVTFGRRMVAAGNTKEARPIMRFGANYKLTQGTFLRASFGQAYRFPTVLEKFVSTSPGGGISTYPNPGLTSETGWTAEVAIKQGFKIGDWMGFFDVAGFWTEYFNMTEFQMSNALFGFWVQNVGDTRITGLETTLAGQGKIGKVKVDLLAGYTYINPVFQDFDQVAQEGSSSDKNVLKYRFRHSLKFDGQATYRGVSLGASIQYYSRMEAIDRYLEDDIMYPTIKNFRDTHLEGTWMVSARIAYTYKAAKLSLLFNNLLNEEFAVRPGMLQAPRNISVRADFTF